MARLADQPQVLDFTEAIEYLLDQALDLKGRTLQINLDEIDTSATASTLTEIARMVYEIADQLTEDDLDRPVRRRELAGQITGRLASSKNVRLRLLEDVLASNRRGRRLEQALGQLEYGDDPGQATDRIIHSLLDLSDRELYEIEALVDWHHGTATL